MAYAIEREESVPAAIARIMGEQIVRARDQLTDSHAPIEKRVHDARKRFKETRAVIRLVRDPLGSQFAVEDAWYRDAGRNLAGARDAQAVIEAFDKLAERVSIRAAVRRRVGQMLEARRDAIPESELAARVTNVVDQLVVAQARIVLWPPLADSFDTVAGGLLRTYRGGRRALRDAARRATPHLLHEWRKFVKTHWYHAQLLRDVWPSMMKAYAAVLEDLSHALGDHHDLFELRQLIVRSPTKVGRPVTVIRLLDAIEHRQSELQHEAFEIGRRVYAESPAEWLARFRKVWSAWRA